MSKKYISDNKRVILITGDETKWFEQAIFIVKKTSAGQGTTTDFVREAEQIIQNYMNGQTQKTALSSDKAMIPASETTFGQTTARQHKRHRSKFDIAVNVLIIVACSAIMLMIGRAF